MRKVFLELEVIELVYKLDENSIVEQICNMFEPRWALLAKSIKICIEGFYDMLNSKIKGKQLIRGT